MLIKIKLTEDDVHLYLYGGTIFLNFYDGTQIKKYEKYFSYCENYSNKFHTIITDKYKSDKNDIYVDTDLFVFEFTDEMEEEVFYFCLKFGGDIVNDQD